MKILITSFLTIIAVAWGWEVLAPDHVSAGSLPWAVRQNILFLTGLLSVSLMSLAMILATRPIWLEKPLGGMDRIYRLHKCSGILTVGFAALHWLVEMSDDLIKTIVGRGGRIRKGRFLCVCRTGARSWRESGRMGLLHTPGVASLTLWKRFPYRAWRPLHRTMPVLYLC